VSELLWPEFSERVPIEIGVKRRDVWQRMQAGLFLMATTGWSVVQELIIQLADRYGIQPNADSLHRVFRIHLRDAGLIHYWVLPHAIKNGLAVVRMTNSGKAMCSAWGWPKVISDWEKLIDCHAGEDQPRHTAMVLDFAWQARRRGYKAVVMPIVQDRYLIPDVYVERDESDRAFVEVERGRNKSEKWFNLNALQGFVAVCLATPGKRINTVEKKIKPQGIGGMATDLKTLKNSDMSEDYQRLWLESW
jgi:hypothetical protein